MRTPSLRWLICGLLSVGCNDSGKGDGQTEGGGGSASSGAVTTAALGTSSSGGDTAGMSASASVTGPGTTTMSGTSATGTTGLLATSSSSGEAETTTGALEVNYWAFTIPGVVSRMEVRKQDVTNDTCSWFRLVLPAKVGLPGISAPGGYLVEFGATSDSAAACDADEPGIMGFAAAVSGTGSVVFKGKPGKSGYPCLISMDIEFDFGTPPVVFLTTDVLQVENLPVDGC